MAGLAVNVDHIATLRQARGINYPDPVVAAVLVELAGADGVVCHLRGDRRHINDRDVKLLREIVKSKLILEMASTSEMLETALAVKPDNVTLVPERNEEISTEGGLDLITYHREIEKSVKTLKDNDIPTCIFIAPDLKQIELAAKINADMIEIHTGAFCDAGTLSKKQTEFEKIVNAAEFGHSLNLGVNAGHGLCYNSIKYFEGHHIIDEFSIGHSIISRAAFVGLKKAVKEMIKLIKGL